MSARPWCTRPADPAIDEIVAVARRPPGDSWYPPRTRFVAADAAVDDLTSVFRGTDAVIHLAWLFQPTHAPMTTWRRQRAGQHSSLRVRRSRRCGKPHPHVVGGRYSPVERPGDRTSGNGRIHERDDPVDESWPTHSTPMAAYGREKAYVERVLDAFEARHPEIRGRRLRPAFVFQRKASTEQRRLFAGPFVPRFIARRGSLPVLPLPRDLRLQAVQAADLAEAFHSALRSQACGALPPRRFSTPMVWVRCCRQGRSLYPVQRSRSSRPCGGSVWSQPTLRSSTLPSICP